MNRRNFLKTISLSAIGIVTPVNKITEFLDFDYEPNKQLSNLMDEYIDMICEGLYTPREILFRPIPTEELENIKIKNISFGKNDPVTYKLKTNERARRTSSTIRMDRHKS